jgi:hypothetical protein
MLLLRKVMQHQEKTTNCLQVRPRVHQNGYGEPVRYCLAQQEGVRLHSPLMTYFIGVKATSTTGIQRSPISTRLR